MVAKGLAQKIIALLAEDARSDLRCAAAMVLGAAGQGEPEAIKALQAQLASDNTMVRRHVLEALEVLGARGLAKDLVPLLGASDEDTRERALRLLSAQGAAAETQLVKTLASGSAGARRQAAQLLAGRDSEGALDALLGHLHDREIGEHVIGLLRAQVIDGGDEARRALLESRVGAELKRLERKKQLEPETETQIALLLRLAGYLADPRSLPVLVTHAGSRWPTYVRLAAIAGLRRLVAGPTRKAGKAGSTDAAVLALLDWADDPDSQVARAAVDTLVGAHIPEAGARKLTALAQARSPDARRLAAMRAAEVSGKAAVPALIAQLMGDDPGLWGPAQRSLGQAAEAGSDLVKALGRATTSSEGVKRLAQALRGHAGRLGAPVQRALAEVTARAQQKGKDGELARLLGELLSQVAPAAGAEQAFARAAALRKKGEYEAAWGELKPIAQSRAALEDEARALLVAVGLKAQGQRLLRAAPSVDPVLAQAAQLARTGAALGKLLGKHKDVGPDELFVLGWNFVEADDPDLKEAGRELLELVLSRSPRSKLGIAARNKLKLVAD
jgi:HEAT repeat protein